MHMHSHPVHSPCCPTKPSAPVQHVARGCATLGTEGPWVDASMIGTWKVHPCPVGGIPTPLKNMKVSWDFSPQHMEK